MQIQSFCSLQGVKRAGITMMVASKKRLGEELEAILLPLPTRVPHLFVPTRKEVEDGPGNAHAGAM